MQAGSLILPLLLEGTVSAFLFGALVGMTNGFFRTVSSYAWPAFFGRQYLGSIYGFTSAMGVVGAALGPLPFGVVYDLTGSYQGILLASAGASLLFFLTSFFVSKPTRALH